MKTPLNKEKIQNHITYSLWKYVLLSVIAVLGWNFIYSVTAYKAPEEKKIIFGVYAYNNETSMNAYMENIRQELMPDMEEMCVNSIMPDDTYGEMILSTRIAARDCDIYLLPRTQFQSYASQGAFMPLEEALPDLIADLEAAGVKLSRGYRASEELGGEKHQYAIPCADLPGVGSMLQIDASDMYLCIFLETGNNDNVIKFFDQFVRDMMVEPVTVTPAE